MTQVPAPHEPFCATWWALEASCDCKKCGARLVWPEHGQPHLHLCSYPDGHAGVHRSAGGVEWVAT